MRPVQERPAREAVNPHWNWSRTFIAHIQCPYVDVFYQVQNDTFVWNAEKAAGNVSRHGVTFEQACEVFADPILLLEDGTSGDEPRSTAIGITRNWKLTCVVHVALEGSAIRIISAWRATAQERRRYEDDA